MTSQFEFPGFRFLGAKTTEIHEIERGTLKDGHRIFTVMVIKSRRHPDDRFVLREVRCGGDRVWTFKDQGFDGICLLARANDKIVIALVNKGKTGRVKQVVPFSSLGTREHIDLRTLIALKRGAAQFLNLQCSFTADEHTESNREAWEEREREKAERFAAEKAARRTLLDEVEATLQKKRERPAQRIAARQERVRRITAREIVVSYTSDGMRRSGWPVLETEWQSLPDGTHVIIVESFDENDKPSKLVEAFKVEKENGKGPKKAFRVPVGSAPLAISAAVLTPEPKPEKPPVIQPIRHVSAISRKGKRYEEVALYRSIDEIRTLRENLTGEIHGAVDNASEVIDVYLIKRDGMDTVGKCYIA